MSKKDLEKLNNEIFVAAIMYINWYDAGELADKLVPVLQRKKLLKAA